MALTPTETQLASFKIHKFATLADFYAVLNLSPCPIGPNDFSIIEENIQADWDQSDSSAPNYIKNKPTIPDAVSGVNDGTNWTSLTIGSTTKNIPGGGSSTLSGLTDTNISSPSAGQTLKYNYDSSKWENSNFPTEIPLQTGNNGKFLTTNGSAVSWASVPTGLTNYDFTHVANTTVSTSTTTITFAANQRGSQMITVSADIGITFDIRNLSDNYLWIKNTGSSEIDVTISSVVNDQTTVSNVYVPTDGISVPAGGICEIGIVRNADGAFLTSRNDLIL